MVLTVYGASSKTLAKIYTEKVEELGRLAAKRGHSLVFGGGNDGLMGAAARGFFEGGAEVIGVTPRFFDADGILFPDCTKLIRTDTMRERKALLETLADAFIVAPGGPGTYDEFFEVLTNKQLDRHVKAIVIYNINHFYDPLLAFLRQAVEQNFIKPKLWDLIAVFEDPAELLDYLETYKPTTFTLEDLKDVTARKNG